MLLRIIDKISEGGEGVELVLEEAGETVQFSVETIDSPFSKNFRELLAWYYRDYSQLANREAGDHGVAEKLLKFGQYLGDRLLGEDHQIFQIVQRIERHGYRQVDVKIESDRVDFFDEFWETLVLPESKYVLSTAIRSFVRQFVGPDYPGDFAEVNMGLKVQAPMADVMTGLGGQETRQLSAQNRQEGSPLHVLHVVSRPPSLATVQSSNAFNTGIQLLAAEGAVHYEILPAASLEDFQTIFDNLRGQIHVVHLDLPVRIDGDQPHFVFGDGEQDTLAARELAEKLVAARIPLLCVDSRDYVMAGEGGGPASVSRGLGYIAREARRAGLGNVLGINQPADPWTSSECFRLLYTYLAGGLTLDQAVVEVRKTLQKHMVVTTFTSQTVKFQTWPLLAHYGGQSVSFFEAPATIVELEQSQILSRVRQRLLGFKTRLLSAPLANVADGHILSIVRALDQGKDAVLISGAPGSGKTHAIHHACFYLVQSYRIDYAFYFDFAAEVYATDDMIEMIAPVLELPAENLVEVQAKLNTLRCSFVFENLSNHLFDGDHEELSPNELQAFIKTLAKAGHRILVSSTATIPLDVAIENVQLAPMPPMEQTILTAQCLRNWQLVDKDQEDGWPLFLSHLHGNPFLIENVIPSLAAKSVGELAAQVREKLPPGAIDYVASFHDWQWALISRSQRSLLLMASAVPGLLLEMLMIACDQKEAFAPGQALTSRLGLETSVADTLEVWNRAGFVQRLPHGRIVDSRCMPFLARKRQLDDYRSLSEDAVQLAFSQVICEGIRLLSRHVIDQRNPALSHNLLFNRRHWVSHFERLWFAGDYRGFMGTKNAFEQLLQQAKLGDEIATWSLDLLERSPNTSVGDDSDIERKLAWLALAASCMRLNDAHRNSAVIAGAEVWRAWFDAFDDTSEALHAGLFHQAAVFLESFYRANGDWHACKEIVGQAKEFCQRRQAWYRVIDSLKSLAHIATQLGETSAALDYEQQIIDTVPYDDAPPGFLARQLLDITVARIGRQAPAQAQQTLDKLKAQADVRQFGNMLEALQGDIFYQQENYLDALPIYSKMWEKALAAEQVPQAEQLKKRLVEIEEKIGQSRFDAIFVAAVAEGTLKPRDYFPPIH